MAITPSSIHGDEAMGAAASRAEVGPRSLNAMDHPPCEGSGVEAWAAPCVRQPAQLDRGAADAVGDVGGGDSGSVFSGELASSASKVVMGTILVAVPLCLFLLRFRVR